MIRTTRTRLARSLRTDAGATAVEYALMIGFIALVIIAAVTLLGTQVSSIFDSAANSI